MKSKVKRNRWTVFDVVVTFIAIVAIIITLYPMVYVFACSISDPTAVLAGKVILWPVGFSTDAYLIVFKNPNFWRALFNSVIYVIAGGILMFFTTVTVAYPLTRPNLKFRKFLTYYLLIPMYFGGGMIPSYIVISKLGLYNTVWALILPGSYSIWNIILCRTYMKSLSNELVDSAAVIMIYTIVGVWNSWFGAQLYTTNKDIQPLQLYLKKIINETGVGMQREVLQALPYEEQVRLQKQAFSANQIKYAVIFATSVPIIAVYPMFQKHFTKGIMLGSLKG